MVNVLLCLSAVFMLGGCGWLWGSDFGADERLVKSRYESEKVPEPLPAQDDDPPLRLARPESITEPTVFDFADCLEYALRFSPYFVQSRLQIESRKIREKNEWWKMFPSIDVRTIIVYNMTEYNRGTRWDTTTYRAPRYNVSFSSGNYVPWEAYFSHDAAVLMTRVAKLAHLSAVNDAIRELAVGFLTMEANARVESAMLQMLALAEQYEGFLQKRSKLGDTTPLDMQIASQEKEKLLGVLERTRLQQELLEQKLLSMIGVPEGDNVHIDYKDAARQILGGGSDGLARPAMEVYQGQLDYRMDKIRGELRDLNILMGWTQYIPQLTLGVRAPDPVNETESGKKDDYFFQLGFRMPLVDWGARYRNIEERKIQKWQDYAEAQTNRLDFKERWRDLRYELRMAKTDLKLAKAEDTLSSMKLRKDQIRFEQGQLDYSRLLQGKRSLLQDKIATARAELSYQRSLLSIEHTSGSLWRRFISAGDLETETDSEE